MPFYPYLARPKDLYPRYSVYRAGQQTMAMLNKTLKAGIFNQA
jgi:hypothetical protein